MANKGRYFGRWIGGVLRTERGNTVSSLSQLLFFDLANVCAIALMLVVFVFIFIGVGVGE